MNPSNKLVQCDAKGVALAKEVNRIRKENGKTCIPISPMMGKVAQGEARVVGVHNAVVVVVVVVVQCAVRALCHTL